MSLKLLWESYEGGKRKFSATWSPGAKAYLRGHVGGHPYFESLGTRDRIEAKSKFAIRNGEIYKVLEDRKRGRGRCNFAFAVKLYFGTSDPGVVDPAGRINKIFNEIALRFLDEFGQADLDALAKKLRPNAGPKTLNREVYTPFIAAYNAAVADGKAPFRKWRRPRGSNEEFETRPPTDVQIAKLIESAERDHGRGKLKALRNKAAILLVTLTGERATAVCKLRGQDIALQPNPSGEPDLDRGAVYFAKTKNGKERAVPLAPIAVRALRDHIEASRVGPKDTLFGWQTRSGLSQMIGHARAYAGLSQFRPHDVGRHSFGRRMTAAGLDRRQLKKAGNWKSDKAVERYEHFDDDQLSEVVRSVDTSSLVTTRPQYRRG